MKLYSENEHYKLYNGNMLDLLEVIDKESIDAVLTDPPYELNFMGKGWDNSGIAFQPDTWQKCYEVLKPGGYLLAFGGSRTFHRIACAIEDAGFEIRDTIMWLYGSGFPKSMDISKQLDKRNGRNINTDFMNYLIENRKKKGLSINKVAELGGWFGNINHGGSVSNWEKGVNIPTKEQYKKLKEILELDDKYDEYINICEAEREVIGQHNFGASSIFGSETYQHRENGKIIDITIPETDLAKQWQGWGTALKPSFEPIIVARKPFKGSLVDNVIEYGVGGINIDECRVGNEHFEIKNGEYDKPTNNAFGHIKRTPKEYDGRFPANTILTYDETDFDEVCGGFPYTKNGGQNETSHRETWFRQETTPTRFAGDSGSASRYFYCAKASKKDRDEGLDMFNQEKVNDGRQTPIDNAFQRGETLRKNTHPTVKPTELMQYLVRLVTPNNGIVLDPFNGSGSTGKAVMYENRERNKNYKYIGIELTEEYLPIAKARIEYVCNLTQEQLKEQQMTIFDYLESKGE